MSLSWARSIQPITPNYFPNIHINIILPSICESSKWSPSLKFPHQNPVRTYLLSYTSHLILLDLITRIIFGEQYRTLISSLCSLLHSPPTSTHLGPNILLNTLFSSTLSLRSSLNVSDQIPHFYKTTHKFKHFVLNKVKFEALDKDRQWLWSKGGRIPTPLLCSINFI